MKTLDQIAAKEQAELERLQSQRGKPITTGYLIRMVAVISLVYILDSMGTDLHNNLQELQITYFSNKLGMEYNAVLSLFTMATAITILVNLISPFYKALADKLGRKPLFIVSTAGMGLGLLLGYFSTNLAVFFIGRLVLTFFVMADIQIIYILEVAPPKKRATLATLTKFFSLLGVLIIPLCRDLMLNETGSNWFVICLVPAAISVVAMILIVFFLRESNAFIDQRIAYLQIPYEERTKSKSKAEKNKPDENKTGLGTALKYVFKNKQTRYIVIGNSLFMVAMNAFVGYFNTICLQSGMDTSQITAALYLSPIGAALITLVGGFIADRFGRKKLCVAYAAVSIASLAGYAFLAGSVSPYFVGALYGLTSGAYWMVGDAMGMMLVESTRTNLRSSSFAAMGLVGMAATIVSMLVYSALVLYVEVKILCIVAGVVVMSLVLVTVLTKVRETNGADLSAIE